MKPTYIPIRSSVTLKYQQWFHWYYLYLTDFKRSSILSHDSLKWNEWEMRMLGYLFLLCRSTDIRLHFEKSMRAEGLCRKLRKVHKPETSVQWHNLISILKFLFHVLKLVILTSAMTRFHCLNWDSRSFDCCLDIYKLQVRSFRSFGWSTGVHYHLTFNK